MCLESYVKHLAYGLTLLVVVLCVTFQRIRTLSIYMKRLESAEIVFNPLPITYYVWVFILLV